MSIAALILGILSLVFCWVPVFGNVAALILGLIGLILAIIAMKRTEKKGVAIAGLVLCIIALIIAVVMMVIIGIGIVTVVNNPEMLEQIEGQAQQIIDALESALPTIAP